MAGTDRDRVLEIYRRLVATAAGIDLKGRATAYTAVNGNMFSFLDPDGVLCLRLSDADRAAFLDRFGGGPVIRYGSVMKGYVAVPGQLLTDDADLADWFARSVAHARSLKPKPTRRR